MGPAQAIKTGIAKSLLFDGRASRSEFLRILGYTTLAACVFQFFAFIAIRSQIDGSALEVGQTASQGYFVMPIIAATLFAFYIVMLPTISRRFKDCGRKGRWFEYTAYLNWAAGFFAIASLCFALLQSHEIARILGGFSMTCIFIPNFCFLIASWIVFVPSDPLSNQYGPNPHDKYGPNPHEVPS